MNDETFDFASLAWVQIWQIGVLGLCVGIANLLVARRWPHLAYALWLVVLAKCFVPPLGYAPANVLGRITPTSPWERWPSAGSSLAARDVLSLSHHVLGQPNNAPHVSSGEQANRISESSKSSSFAPQAGMGTGATSFNVGQVLMVVWLSGGVLLCGIAIGRSSVVNQRLRRSATPIGEEIRPFVVRVSERLGLRRDIRVMQTATNIGPVVMGLWRPTIYLPARILERVQPPQLEAMLTHELVHVRRRDTWVAALQFAAQTLWWFHPVVWWMNFRITRERERCCDEEVVVSLQGRRADYARSLVTVLEANHELEPLWFCPAVRSADLTRNRLEEIMKRRSMKSARSPRWCWAIALLLAVAVLPNSGRSAVDETENKQDGERGVRVAQNAKSATSAAEPQQSSARPPVLLSYGDGKADGKKSYGGSGHMIRFEMPAGVTKVRGLRIHGSRYGLPQAPDEDFEITFLSDDLQETLESQAAPYRLFKRGKENWVRVLFDKEVELPEKFWVALNFNAHQTKGVYLSYDISTKGEYSRAGLPGSETEPKETDFSGDWMVQVMLSRPTE